MVAGSVVGCTTTQKGAGAGAAVGAGIGAIIGHQSGHRDKGAAIGAVLGGATGAIAGERIEKKLYCPECGKQSSGETGVTHCPHDGAVLKPVTQ
ncbi:MAG: glycine zipper 2TM domain-containing protein [Planctomycetes bacterium]|nr:glycine zipper 2TM domain-containing protein [Planctomycetota bacterium]